MAAKKPGPAPKGARDAHTLRVPREHLHHYVAEQKRLGYPDLNAYLTAMLATQHHLPVPHWAEPAVPEQDQLELPIGA